MQKPRLTGLQPRSISPRLMSVHSPLMQPSFAAQGEAQVGGMPLLELDPELAPAAPVPPVVET
jgi:hypothetical protein